VSLDQNHTSQTLNAIFIANNNCLVLFWLSDAIIRETFEETGLKIYKDDIELIDERMEGKNYCYCFRASEYFGTILSQDELKEQGETGIVKWVDRSVLETGFC
jgi:ADP-ribose pyrophosphatase YjhB (NUDIX family)